MKPLADDCELIAIRADEQLDLTQLEPYLRAHLPAANGPLTVRQFGGGHANLTYLLRFENCEFVLRRPPLGPVAPSAHDMRREYRVLSVLHRAFAPAPRALLLCTDPAIAGADFIIEERRHGIVIRHDLPAVVAQDATLPHRLGCAVAETLAALHLVDAAAVGLEGLGRPAGYVDRQIDGWTGRWHAAADREIPDAAGVIAWLDRRRPQTTRTALVHNDYKLDNLLLDAADPGRVNAVLDWDMCTLGDPLMDLGYLLNFWPQHGDDPRWIEGTPAPTAQPGFPTRRELVARYARATGFEIAAIEWYFVFGVFRLIVILQQIYIRYLRGQTQDARFAAFGRRVELLFEKARTLIERGAEL